MSDDSLHSLLYSRPVIDSVFNVVIPQADPQVLNVVFAHTTNWDENETKVRRDQTY